MSETPTPPSPPLPPPEPGSYQAHLAAEAAAPEIPPALLDLKARWAALSSTQRLRGKQVGVAAVVGLLGYGLYTANSVDAPVATAPTASKLDMGAGLRGDSLELKLRGDIQKVLDGQTMLGDRVTAIEQGKVAIGPKAGPGLAGVPVGMLDDAGLPPALPGVPSAFPPAPAAAAAEAGPPLTSVADLPAAPPAPLAPPQEKLVGAIGAATAALVPKEAATAEGLPKKSCGRSICRLVS